MQYADMCKQPGGRSSDGDDVSGGGSGNKQFIDRQNETEKNEILCAVRAMQMCAPNNHKLCTVRGR